MRRRTNRKRGVAIVEFTLSLVFLIPLLLGVFVFGFRLIRSLQMMQITRDLGHMYIRGIDFRNAGPIANAQTLAQSFDLTGTGTSVVFFSRIKMIQQSDCDAANAIAPVIPAGTACVNLNKPVFLEQVTVGNSSSGSSNFGAPPLQTDKTVTIKDQGRNTAAQATGFTSIMTLQSGEFAFVTEMVNRTPELNIPGFSGAPQVYSRSIF